jgi:hypothetical protein
MAKKIKTKTNTKAPTPVEAIKHKDSRVNIPTEELRDFVAEEERAPKTMRCPRDPSLDPQLVWKGKDDQDAADLAVPIVPIYMQEKIHPQTSRRLRAATAKAAQFAEQEFLCVLCANRRRGGASGGAIRSRATSA